MACNGAVDADWRQFVIIAADFPPIAPGICANGFNQAPINAN